MEDVRRGDAILAWLWERSRGQRLGLLLLILGNILFAGSLVCFSLICRSVIDGAAAGDLDRVLRAGAALAGVIGLQCLLRLWVNGLQEHMKAGILNSYRRELLHQLLGKDYASLKEYHSGELVNRMFSDVQVVADGILGILPPFANMATRFFGALLILLGLDPAFTGLLVAAGVLAFAVSRLLRGRMKSLHRLVQESEGRVHACLQETVENIRLVKASGLEPRMERQAEEYQQTYFRAFMRRRSWSVTANAGLALLFQAGYLGALLWGSIRICSRTMSYGTLTAILQLVGQIQTPVSGMSGILQRYYGMTASAERLRELFSLPEEEADGVPEEGEKIDPAALSEIRLEDVSFSYGSTEVLDHVGLSFYPGECMALTGASGAGKSTLFLLLLGIYRPTGGEILFLCGDGGRRRPGRSTRGLFAYVPQGNTLFSGTIRENVTLFADQPTEDEIEAALETACAGDFIREMPRGLDTVIGERGIGLSEGQAQRIAVARAVLGGAPVLLLDEATSALDEETEARMLRNIAGLPGRTCLIVTHRRAALEVCSRRIHLDKCH